jgi:hypothetical protein
MNNTNTTIKFLICPVSQLSGFACATDRRYFSRPVAVEVLPQAIGKRGLVYVHDPVRGHTYPVDPKNLHSKHHLTKKQRAAA